MHSTFRLSWIICFAFMFSIVPSGMAQSIHYYSAAVSGMNGTLQEKQMEQMLADLDPDGVARIDRSAGTVEWKSIVRMDRFQFEHRIGRLGLSLISYEERIGNGEPVVRGERVHRLADMPLYMDTGDPVLDNARYDAYKAAWIATHQEEYLELTAPTSGGTSTDKH